MKKFLSLVLALVMTMSLVTISAGAKDFTDDSKIDYKEAVDVVSAVKIVEGYADGSFNPSATLTRGAAAKIICNLILGPTTAGALVADAAPYSDVPANSTFAGYIAFCQKEGIISGYADGTFKPGNTLTGYAFMKMLLGALGYDQTAEGYTGANWSINVAKRALNIGLDDDLSGDFNGTKAVTREEACLYAFNALQAKPVTYPNSSTIVVGDVTVSTSAKAVEGDNKYYVDLFDGNLVKDETVTDAFGRPATTWTYKKAEVGTYGKEADAVYTNNAKLYTVRTDLGITSNSDTNTFYYTINSTSVVNGGTTYTLTVPGNGNGLNYYTSTSTTKLADVDIIGAYAGNGVTVEFFYDKDDHTENKIVVIDEFIDEIDDVDSDDDGRYVTISDGNFHTEEFEEGDMVLYTLGNDGIASMALTEKLTGKVSKVVGTGASAKYTIDGTVYELHKGTTASVSVGDEVEFYLDSCGYIIDIDQTGASTAVENLVLFADKTTSGWDTIAKAIYATGKTETVTLKDSATGLMNVYSFTTSSGKVKVSSNSDYTSVYGGDGTNVYYFTKGATTITCSDSTSVKVNNGTTFVYVDGNGDAKVYTGYKNAPNVGGAGAQKIVAYVKNSSGVASVVYIWTAGSSVSSSNKNLTYVIADTYDQIAEKNADDETVTFYEVRTLAGDTVRVNSTVYTEVSSYTTNGVVVYKNMVKDDDGIVDTADIKDTNIGTGTLGTGKVAKEDKGVIYLDGTGVAYTDDVVVYVIDADGDDFSTIKVTSINDNAGKYAGYTYVTNDDGEITTLVLKKA